MTEQELDLLVIGGGITGCGIALDAALRGLKVGLIEMQDFASGTSSRSTKLIHGGLRYLKQGEINLVREVGQERAILYKNAPHVVIPEPMLLPLVKDGTYGKIATSIGLWMYDRLAGVQKDERRKMLSKEETLKREPLLKQEGLKGGGLYVEYRTDDARLTIEVIKTAVSQGTLAVNYTQAKQFNYHNGKVMGVLAEDTVNKQEYTLQAKKIVNATGPWVDGLRELDKSLYGKILHLTKGVHIVVDQQKFPLQQAIYFDVSNGRMIFAIPRDGKTYIGTTDTNYEGDIVNPQMNEEDLTYLLKATNDMFPSISLIKEDVESHWVGLRPLIHEDGKAPSELSRKDEIFRSDSGLITIAGGKLTGFRKMAEKVVNLVVAELEQIGQKKYPACKTAVQILSGGDVRGIQQWPSYLQEKVTQLIELEAFREKHEKKEKLAREMVQRYGSNLDQVLAYLPKAKELAEQYGIDSLLIAELMYAMEKEMVMKADDFLVRRTGMAYFNNKNYIKYYSVIENLLNTLNMNEKIKKQTIDLFRQ